MIHDDDHVVLTDFFCIIHMVIIYDCEMSRNRKIEPNRKNIPMDKTGQDGFIHSAIHSIHQHQLINRSIIQKYICSFID